MRAQKTAHLNTSLEGLCSNENNENTIITLWCCRRGYNGELFQCSSGPCPVIVRCDQREVFTLDMISLEESEEKLKEIHKTSHVALSVCQLELSVCSKLARYHEQENDLMSTVMHRDKRFLCRPWQTRQRSHTHCWYIWLSFLFLVLLFTHN